MNTIKFELIRPRWKLSPLRLFSSERKRIITRQVPEGWHEMNKKQVRIAVGLMMRTSKDKLGSQLMAAFLNVRRRQIRLMNMSQMEDISASMDFVLDKSSMINNHLSEIKVDGVIWYGPNKALGNVTFNQFIFADTLFLRYSQNQQRETLHQFIAALYSESKHKPTPPEHIEEVAMRLKKISEVDANAIILYYIGSRNKIVKSHRWLFPESKTQSKSKDDFTWVDTLYDLVGDRPSDMEKVENLNLWKALGYLDKKAKEQSKKKK